MFQICILKHALTKACSDPRYTVLKATVHELLTSMKTRYENYLENEYLIAATTLDPRYKSFLFYFLSQTSILNSLLNMNKDMEKNQNLEQENVSSATSTDVEGGSVATTESKTGAEPQKDFFNFETCFNDLMSQTQSSEREQKNQKKKLKRVSSSSTSSNTIKTELQNI